MTLRLLTTGAILVVLFLTNTPELSAQASYERLPSGLILRLDEKSAESARTVKLEVITDDIIHVVASATDTLPVPMNLMTVPQLGRTPFTIKNNADTLFLATSRLRVEINMGTGALVFKDIAGNVLLAERGRYGRSFRNVTYQGESSYAVKQVFESPETEALYGLGQHQDDVINYKGQHIELFQYNTKVAIPFLLSSKNYGILWNNYSYTKVGDTRDLMPLSALKLYADSGEEGWLTAKYGSRSDSSIQPLMKAESEIDYSFLSDQYKFPTGYNLADGKVIWSGKIASDETGRHSFDLKYAGYVKVWIDGKLLADKWRQAWNPGSAMLQYAMEKGRKYAIRIEWLPDGGESYLALRCLTPVPAAEKNTYAFDSQAADAVDYYFVAGKNADQVISGYRILTGKAVMLPKWAMGFWQSRERYKTAQELLSTVKEFRDRKIPLDNIVQDWSYWKEDEWGRQEFDRTRFPDPAGMISKLHKDYHANFIISVWPKFYEGTDAYDYMNSHGWLYKRNIADGRRDWIGKGYRSTFYDALNPEARKAFWRLLDEHLYRFGVDGWWMDAAEPDVHSNLDMATRQSLMSPNYLGSGVKYFNAFPLGNAMGIYEGQRLSNSKQRPLILTRSAYAGQQRYATIVWSGDIASRWEDMRSQISAGINFSMSGLPYWSMDAGGFSVERRYEKAAGADLDEWRELNTRWFQFAAFVPVFRSHGQYPFREVYHIAPEEHPAYQSIVYYTKLRYRLMPYIYSLAGMAYHHDYTLMRGLAMDFAKDTTVLNIGDEYMFGPALLVNPVCKNHALSRRVYLPAAEGWYDLYSGTYYKGGQYITAEAPYERMPVFVKAGSIVPMGAEVQYTSATNQKTITLYVYTGDNAHFTLYEDESLNNNYEKGAFSEISFNYDERSGKLLIGKRRGKFQGMPEKRNIEVVWVSKDAENGGMDSAKQKKTTVLYDGNEITINKN